MTPDRFVIAYHNGASHAPVDEDERQSIEEIRPGQDIEREVKALIARVKLFHPRVFGEEFVLPSPGDLPQELALIIGKKASYTFKLDPRHLVSDESSTTPDDPSVNFIYRPFIGMSRRGQVQEIVIEVPNDGLAPTIDWKTAGQSKSKSEFEPKFILKAAFWSVRYAKRVASGRYPNSWSIASL